MPNPETFFTEAFMRWVIDRWVVIHSFRRVFRAGLSPAKPVVSAYAERIVREYLGAPENAELYIGAPEHRDETMTQLAHAMAAADIENSQASVDAASVVFAHAILDGAAFDCCRISSMIAPADWEVQIAARQVPLTVLKEASREEIVRDMVEKYVATLERESLLKKVDLLFARCQPAAGWSPMNNYAFNRARLEAFDQLRHDTIHGSGPRPIPNLDVELDYLSRTTFFLFGLLNHRYQLKVDLSYIARRSFGVSPAP